MGARVMLIRQFASIQRKVQEEKIALLGDWSVGIIDGNEIRVVHENIAPVAESTPHVEVVIQENARGRLLSLGDCLETFS